MSVTVDQLAAAIHQFFAAKLPGPVGDSPGDVLLVFDAFGDPLNPNDFGAGAPDGQRQLFAHQRAAQLADQVPAANGLANGWYQKQTGVRLSQWYQTAVSESVCTETTDVGKAAFEKRKAAALEALDLNAQVMIAGPTAAGTSVDPTGVSGTVYATGMAPSDWYQPASQSWESHHIAASDAAPVPPGPLPLPDIRLRTLAAPAVDGAPPPGAPPPPTPLTMPKIDSPTPAMVTDWMKKVGDFVVIQEPLVEVETDKITMELPSPATGTLLQIAAQVGDPVPTGVLLGLVGTGAPVPPPTADGFDVTFDYCIVTFDRPWWDPVFLSTPDWSVTGFSAGQISSGRASAPAAPVPAITTGVVAVRNLKITANWSAHDHQVLSSGAAALGPFSTDGASFDGQTLSRPGMQALAWVCQVPPVLPPK